ncbi:unnamed protein product [Amoebophrya sp. A120]|nr:unnamed protein product [Amoebophrya sp. A120]|eukprot:GSA120T00000760001.1
MTSFVNSTRMQQQRPRRTRMAVPIPLAVERFGGDVDMAGEDDDLPGDENPPVDTAQNPAINESVDTVFASTEKEKLRLSSAAAAGFGEGLLKQAGAAAPSSSSRQFFLSNSLTPGAPHQSAQQQQLLKDSTRMHQYNRGSLSATVLMGSTAIQPSTITSGGGSNFPMKNSDSGLPAATDFFSPDGRVNNLNNRADDNFLSRQVDHLLAELFTRNAELENLKKKLYGGGSSGAGGGPAGQPDTRTSTKTSQVGATAAGVPIGKDQQVAEEDEEIPEELSYQHLLPMSPENVARSPRGAAGRDSKSNSPGDEKENTKPLSVSERVAALEARRLLNKDEVNPVDGTNFTKLQAVKAESEMLEKLKMKSQIETLQKQKDEIAAEMQKKVCDTEDATRTALREQHEKQVKNLQERAEEQEGQWKVEEKNLREEKLQLLEKVTLLQQEKDWVEKRRDAIEEEKTELHQKWLLAVKEAEDAERRLADRITNHGKEIQELEAVRKADLMQFEKQMEQHVDSEVEKLTNFFATAEKKKFLGTEGGLRDPLRLLHSSSFEKIGGTTSSGAGTSKRSTAGHHLREDVVENNKQKTSSATSAKKKEMRSSDDKNPLASSIEGAPTELSSDSSMRFSLDADSGCMVAKSAKNSHVISTGHTQWRPKMRSGTSKNSQAEDHYEEAPGEPTLVKVFSPRGTSGAAAASTTSPDEDIGVATESRLNAGGPGLQVQIKPGDKVINLNIRTTGSQPIPEPVLQPLSAAEEIDLIGTNGTSSNTLFGEFSNKVRYLSSGLEASAATKRNFAGNLERNFYPGAGPGGLLGVGDPDGGMEEEVIGGSSADEDPENNKGITTSGTTAQPQFLFASDAAAGGWPSRPEFVSSSFSASSSRPRPAQIHGQSVTKQEVDDFLGKINQASPIKKFSDSDDFYRRRADPVSNSWLPNKHQTTAGAQHLTPKQFLDEFLNNKQESKNSSASMSASELEEELTFEKYKLKKEQAERKQKHTTTAAHSAATSSSAGVVVPDAYRLSGSYELPSSSRHVSLTENYNSRGVFATTTATTLEEDVKSCFLARKNKQATAKTSTGGQTTSGTTPTTSATTRTTTTTSGGGLKTREPGFVVTRTTQHHRPDSPSLKQRAAAAAASQHASSAGASNNKSTNEARIEKLRQELEEDIARIRSTTNVSQDCDSSNVQSLMREIDADVARLRTERGEGSVGSGIIGPQTAGSAAVIFQEHQHRNSNSTQHNKAAAGHTSSASSSAVLASNKQTSVTVATVELQEPSTSHLSSGLGTIPDEPAQAASASSGGGAATTSTQQHHHGFTFGNDLVGVDNLSVSSIGHISQEISDVLPDDISGDLVPEEDSGQGATRSRVAALERELDKILTEKV